MRASWVVGWAVVAASAVASSARADMDLAAQNGDVIRASIGAPGDVDTYRFDCPAGVVIDVVAKPVNHGPALSLTLFDDGGNQIGFAAAPDVVALHVRSIGDRGYSLSIAAQNATSTGDYVVSLSWKTPQPALQRVSLTRSFDRAGSITFRAWRGDIATATVRRAPGSNASPSLSWVYSDNSPSGYRQLRRSTTTIDRTGNQSLELQNLGAPGDAVVSVSLRSGRRRLSFTRTPIPSEVQIVAAASVAPDRPNFAFGDPISSFYLAYCGVEVPRGAVRSPTSIWIGRAPDFDPGVPGWQAVTPAMFVGPAGLKFRRKHLASVTLAGDCSAGCRVFARGADGAVSEIPQSQIEPGDSYYGVTFAANRAATYQAFTPIQPYHGVAVAATDDVVAVGTPGQGSGAYVNTGEVRILARDGAAWTQEALLTDDAPLDNDFFGNVVALSGDTLVVGGPRTVATAARRAVLVYVRGADHYWTLQATLQTTDSAITSDWFGSSVAIDGDTIVVGAPYESRSGSAYEGAAYVVERNGASWAISQRLTTPPGAYATFGDHVAVSGNSLLVGDASAPTTVYARSAAEWSQEAQLAPAPASSLALDGDTAVIGYQGDAAFVMSRSGTTWTLRATLRPQADGYASSTFGASVSVHAGRILVGSPHYGSSVGAFLYADSPDGPHLLQAVGGFDKALNNGLGAAVALTPSGSTAIVGADSPATAFEYDVP